VDVTQLGKSSELKGMKKSDGTEAMHFGALASVKSATHSVTSATEFSFFTTTSNYALGGFARPRHL